jgi:hypothetical protein
MAIMAEKRVRHLRGIEGKRIIGIVSMGDLVKSFDGRSGEKHYRRPEIHHRSVCGCIQGIRNAKFMRARHERLPGLSSE